MLPASVCGSEGYRTPDLTMSFKWDSVHNDFGYAGHVYSTGGAVGQGTHGSMSTNNGSRTARAGEKDSLSSRWFME